MDINDILAVSKGKTSIIIVIAILVLIPVLIVARFLKLWI